MIESRVQPSEEEMYFGRSVRPASGPAVGHVPSRGDSAPPSNNPAKGKPHVERKDPRIKKLQAILAGRGWVKRAIIFAELGVEDRVGRVLKRLSRGRIISDSGKGYRLAAEATEAELLAAEKECEDRIESETETRDNIRKIRQKRTFDPQLATANDEPAISADNYFGPLDNAEDEARAQRVFAYDEIRRATVIREWDKEYEKGQPFDVGSPSHTIAVRCRDLKLRVLRLIEKAEGQ